MRKNQKIIGLFVSVAMLLNLAIPALIPVSSAQTMKVLNRSVFQPGDAVRIEIMEVEVQSKLSAANFNINGDYTIDKEGTIFMPLIGTLKVTGHDQESLTKLIADKYSPYFSEPFIKVVPLIRMVLIGAFNKPGSYRIDPDESLWELISYADGPADGCDLKTLRVKRGGRIVIKNLLSSFEQGHSLRDIGVRSGDQVEALFKDRVTMRDVIDYTNFLVSLAVLYIQIRIMND
ncbi:polysaccharide biosynthesis/export family protein [candidate division KSB1 bacterium]|nr:polysaccharide biosynthesis/export family protein [candidate division KSB1 bacterium]